MRELTFERGEVRMLALALLGAIGIGVLAAATSPLVPFAALVGLAILVAIWLRPWLGGRG